MKVKQRLNNNVVLVDSDKGMIVMGKGIGFKAYPGDYIDEGKIERTFVIKNKEDNDFDKLSLLLEEIPMEYIMLSDTITLNILEDTGISFNFSMVVTIANYIFSAMKRKEANNTLDIPLSWDIKLLYPDEIMLSEMIIDIASKQLKVSLDKSEVVGLALQFITTNNNYQIGADLFGVTKVISDVKLIIQSHFQIKIEQNSIYFTRFITLLLHSLTQEKPQMIPFSPEAINLIIKQYPKSYEFSEKIATYINKNYGIKYTPEEKVYLMIHIENIIQK